MKNNDPWLHEESSPIKNNNSSSTLLGLDNPQRLIFLILILLFIVAISIYFITRPSKNSSAETSEGNKSANPVVTYFNLPEMMVNLLPIPGKQNYLKINLSLQLKDSADASLIEKKVPLLRDTLIMFLRGLYYSDFTGSGSNIRLKAELLRRVNKVAVPVVVEDVLIEDIFVE